MSHDPEATLPPHDRRHDDPRIAQLAEDLATNTSLTAQNAQLIAQMKGTVDEVRDILTSFRVLGKFAKWSSGIGAAILGLVAAWKGLKG